MNYIGSKKSLISFIEKTITNTTSDAKVFCDLFAGTGVVSKHFSSKYDIIANDIQYYSFVLLNAILKTKKIKKIDLSNLDGIEGFIYQNFSQSSGRLFFTDENAKKCDAIRTFISGLKGDEYYYYLASLLEAIDKVANTASVYGAFLKKFKKSALKPLELKPFEHSNNTNNIVYNQNANDLITKIEGDILYLDPPYNQRQYSANYHVLEIIAKYDNPKIKGKTGLPVEYFKSKYSSKLNAVDALENLIQNAKFKHIYLSYNNEGIIPIESIKTIFKRYGKYDRFEKEYKTFKQDKKRNNKSSNTIEYIHYLEKIM